MSRLPPEPEILAARLAFPDAQAALEGVAEALEDVTYRLGWYGTTVHPDRGAFAMVNIGGEAEKFVGDRLRLWHGNRSVIVYCFGATDLPHDIAITRRAFAAMELLTVEELLVRVEVLTS